jgi:hypothetical protein
MRLVAALLLGLSVLAPSGANAAGGASAPQKVLLITSLDGMRMARALPWYLAFRRGYFRNYDLALERIFRDFFRARGFEAEVEHEADQSDLAAALRSPEYSAIYLVSHEAVYGTPLTGVSGGGVYDYEGYEITPVLSEIHPQLKALALVGCVSEPLIQSLQASFGAAGTNPDLKLLGFSREVDAKKGLKQALRASLAHLLDPSVPSADCRLKQGYPIEFRRTCGATPGPAMRIVASGDVVAVFARCQAGEVQLAQGFVESHGATVTAGELKFEFTSGSNVYGARPELGKLEISRPGQAADEGWTAFSKPDGTPFGTTTHVYLHSGTLPSVSESRPYPEFSGCPLN